MRIDAHTVDAAVDRIAGQLRLLTEEQRARFIRRLSLLVKFPDRTNADAPYSFWLGREAA